MPSPDTTPYTGLALYDVDPQDIMFQALQARETVLPEYDPQPGDPDIELMGSLANIAAEMVYALNRVPNGVVEVLGRFLGVERLEGGPARAQVEVTVAPNPLGVEIPANTAFSLDLGTGTVIIFLTDAAAVSAPNATTVTIPATATVTGTEGNNVPSGTVLTVRSQVTAINSARLASATAGGTDPESDQSWQSRVVTTLARLTSTLVKPEHFQQYAVAWPGVWRALAVDNWDGAGTPGAQAGYVTTAVRAEAGAAVPGAVKSALQAAMDAASQANLIVNVQDATVTPVDVAVTVHVKPGYDPAAVADAVEDAVGAYLNPDVWDWAATVRANEIVALADQVEGVDWVSAATVGGSATVTFPNPATLATAGTVTVSTA